jgi:hypothetical protein
MVVQRRGVPYCGEVLELSPADAMARS